MTDSRVTVFDRTDIHTADLMVFGGPFDLAVADLSFMSLAPIAPIFADLLVEGGALIALVKPQFESRKDHVGENGIVTARDVQASALDRVVESLAHAGMGVLKLAYSPVKGTKGNIEFFVFARKGAVPATISTGTVVEEAHRELD